MKSRPHVKPIGEAGPIRVTHSDGDPIVTWERIRFPAQKSAQEMAIASAFAKQLSSDQLIEWTVDQLGEDDFDFRLISDGDKRYLELQEIVIPPPKRGRPYASREQIVQSKRFSDSIWSEIRKKSLKYPRAVEYPLDLLVYVTHWRFLTTDTVRRLVAHHLKRNEHPFTHVYEFSIIDERSGAIQILYPNDELLQDFHPVAVAAHRYANFDPATRRSIKNDDGSIGVRFDLSSEAVAKLFGPKGAC
jgi:hypothetical protein